MQRKIVVLWKEQKEAFLMSIFSSILSVMMIVMVKTLKDFRDNALAEMLFFISSIY
jgi:hypothetical protein